MATMQLPLSTTAVDAPGLEPVVLGKVASPPRQEATSEQFHFWVSPAQLVEKTQIVRTTSTIAGRTVTWYAVVDEVFRRSRKRDISEEFDGFDGDVSYEPEFAPEGVTFATASILRSEPPVLTPPMEGSDVVLGGEHEALLAYGADEIDNGLAVGLIKNGGGVLAGPGYIDLDYLLGANGGHMNVNGSAGRGTKSSFLLFTVAQLLNEAHRRRVERPSDPNPLLVVPIVFNVKGFDLFYIHRWNRRYDHERDAEDWRTLGVDDPQPFHGTTFYAPQMKGGTIAIPTGSDASVQPYSWSLRDIIELGLFPFLFADEDTQDANFGALVLDIEQWLTDEHVANDGLATLRLRVGDSVPQTLQGLLDWTRNGGPASLPGHHLGTWGKLYRRLFKLVAEGEGVLRRHDRTGHPLRLIASQTRAPCVVDLNGLTTIPSLQRFVVATVLRQLVEARTGPVAVRGLVYIVVLDELNRFAPRGSRDAITQLIERVAAEMRSQGIILLGAQQQASKVSEKVVENAAIRVVGRSGALELDQPIWRNLSQSARRKAASLSPREKLIVQDSFREPMHVRVPFPVWAMRPAEVLYETGGNATPDDEIATW